MSERLVRRMRPLRIITLVVGFIALLLIVQGVLGIVAPEAFVRFVGYFQRRPVIYIAAMLRVAIGFTLICAAPTSNAPRFLRIFGFIVFIGGVLTPFVGAQFAHLILDWWSARGPVLVRLFAGVSLVLGLLTAYAVASKPPNV